jgi:hypothetical protein
MQQLQGIKDSEKCWKFCGIVFNHLPFLSTASFFRIASMAILITFFNSYGFAPVGVYWIGTLFIGYKRLLFRSIYTTQQTVSYGKI